MKKALLYVMSVFYIGAGVNHFLHPQLYMQIMPPWLPYHSALVMLSGLCEIAGGLLLLPASTRSTGAWFIILLLIAIFPANIQMALDFYREHNPKLWLAIARLPLQLVLIYWAWVYRRAGA